MITKLLVIFALFIQIGQFCLAKMRHLATKNFGIVDVWKELLNLQLPFLKSSRKWLDELIEEKA